MNNEKSPTRQLLIEPRYINNPSQITQSMGTIGRQLLTEVLPTDQEKLLTEDQLDD